MNQVNNKTPYGLLTEDEQAQFCEEAKEREMYEFYYEGWTTAKTGSFAIEYAYRLKVVKSEIYYCENGINQGWLFAYYNKYAELTSFSKAIPSIIKLGDIAYNGFICKNELIQTLRPATAAEIEQFNKAFEPEECMKVYSIGDMPPTKKKKPTSAHKPDPIEESIQVKPTPVFCSLKEKADYYEKAALAKWESKPRCKTKDCQDEQIFGANYCLKCMEKPKKKKKSGWKIWQKDCGKKKPKEGTYTDVQWWNLDYWDNCTSIVGESFFYRYKKVKK